MKNIIRGVASFHRDAHRVRPLLERLAVDGQHPRALLLTCVDARLDPMMLTRAEPGDILVHRNVGSVVPRPDVGDGSLGAAVEFALTALDIPNIVVMGHSHCGAMKAALGEAPSYGPLSRWLDHTDPARQRFLNGERLNPDLCDSDNLSQINVLQSLDHLAEYPVVKERIQKMSVTLHGWWFDIPSATVYAYDRRAGNFVPVEQVYPVDTETELAS